VSENKPGLLAQMKSYPAQFWVANTMEIFERMAWYGWFTVMAVYVTGTPETGGLGFSTEMRGSLMAIIPFFLYVLPVFTGAIADRYGFRKTFVVAYLIMIVAYYLLGQFQTFPQFFLAFMFVAVGAALFKPVVVGTVAKVTTDSNSATGFGIFYMMVNIGGFVGPIVAGIVRGWGWEYVFMACSMWAGVNLLIVLTLYREPEVAEGQRSGKFRQVLDNMVEVLGNFRFFMTIFVVLIALMAANLRVGPFAHFTWTVCAFFVPLWIILNILWDQLLPKDSGKPAHMGGQKRGPFVRRMFCSNWRFALFLLIMSGFWTSFIQIFYTMPEYIRDYVETRPMISLAEGIFGESDQEDYREGIAASIATINDVERDAIERRLTVLSQSTMSAQELDEASRDLIMNKIRITPQELVALIEANSEDTDRLVNQVIIAGRQVNPEFIVNIDAGAIVLFQIFVSFLMARFHRFTTMIVGMVIAAVGVGLSFFAGGEGMVGLGGSIFIVALGLFTFAIGEMMASPTSQEYIGRIAPANKKALYMGYYFVSMALGNLFGGILSGELYGSLARDAERPDLMWAAFGGIMFLTAVMFLAYDRFAVPRGGPNAVASE